MITVTLIRSLGSGRPETRAPGRGARSLPRRGTRFLGLGMSFRQITRDYELSCIALVAASRGRGRMIALTCFLPLVSHALRSSGSIEPARRDVRGQPGLQAVTVIFDASSETSSSSTVPEFPTT